METALILIGALWTFNFLAQLLYRIYRLFQLNHLDLIKRYGSNSFVVITGASDGIGKGLSFAFAKLGFNLVLISRTRAKLDEVKELILNEFKSIKVLSFALDFSQAYQPGFFDELHTAIKDLDISIVINNAGLLMASQFVKGNEKDYIDLMICNTIPPVTLTHKFLPYLIKRSSRSAIINLSSIQGVIPIPYTSVYSATKGLLDHFTNAIRHEFKNVDFINVRPGFVSTGMTLNKKKSFDTLTVDECVDAIIRDIGLVENTYGHWRHQIQNHFIEGLPLSLVHYVYMKSEVAKLLKIR